MTTTPIPDTRQRFTVTVELTLKTEGATQAVDIVTALLEPLPMVKPFSISYPPAVVGVRVRDGADLNPDEAAAFDDILKAAGVDPESDA